MEMVAGVGEDILGTRGLSHYRSLSLSQNNL